jgi:NAD(P)H-hydrate epimerase
MEALSIAAQWCGEADILVDAIFGEGLSRPPSGLFAEVIRIFNDSDGIRVALDIPSGLDADSGNPLGETVRADLTVTFGAPKIGLYTAPGFEWCGETVVADISLPVAAKDAAPRVICSTIVGGGVLACAARPARTRRFWSCSYLGGFPRQGRRGHFVRSCRAGSRGRAW